MKMETHANLGCVLRRGSLGENYVSACYIITDEAITMFVYLMLNF